MRVGVVAGGYQSSWDEEEALVARLCGALACGADVELVVAAPGEASVGWDGAVRVVGVPATAPDLRRQEALRLALFGPGETGTAVGAKKAHRARQLPKVAQEAVLAAGGGWSDGLARHLKDNPYDIVVVVGIHRASTHQALALCTGRRPCVMVPLATATMPLWMPLNREALGRADRVVAITAGEVSLLEESAPELSGAGRVRQVGFVVGVNDLASRTAPFGFDGCPTMVVVRDWRRPAAVGSQELLRWSQMLEGCAGGKVALRAVGPGADRLPLALRTFATDSRMDAWRWVVRALGVLDPESHHVTGREVLESFLLRTPAVVARNGGASREHAELGGGGSWYDGDAGLLDAVTALLDGDARADLVQRGRAYAAERYGDTGQFIDRVQDSVLGLVA